MSTSTTDPTLRARVSAILAAFPADPVANVLATVAEEAAGWREGCTADVTWAAGVLAVGSLGRPLLPDEATALEACIRAHLEAGAP